MASVSDILKIATFNINGIRSRLDALLEWLEREGPDVVCLQELKARDAAFPIGPRPASRKRPRADLDRAGYGREEERSETAAQHGQAVKTLRQKITLGRHSR